MTTLLTRPPERVIAAPSHDRAFGLPRHALWLSLALAVVTVPATALTFFVDGVLRGTEVMNGSARGTALVALVLGGPVLFISMRMAAGGSARAVFVWFGSTLYLAYNAFLLLFATPFNELFLLYVAMLSLSIASAVVLVTGVDCRDLADRCNATMPRRALAVYLWAVVGGNAFAWLGSVVPALFDERPDFLVDTGLTTNPVYVQDLAFWLPLFAVAGVWLWQGRALGHLLTGAILSMWVLEGITVATDQWMGHAADRSSDVVSVAAVPGFAVASIVCLGVLVTFLRHVRTDPLP